MARECASIYARRALSAARQARRTLRVRRYAKICERLPRHDLYAPPLCASCSDAIGCAAGSRVSRYHRAARGGKMRPPGALLDLHAKAYTICFLFAQQRFCAFIRAQCAYAGARSPRRDLRFLSPLRGVQRFTKAAGRICACRSAERRSVRASVQACVALYIAPCVRQRTDVASPPRAYRQYVAHTAPRIRGAVRYVRW